MAIHVQLIGTTVLYLFAFVCGILLVVTVGIAKGNIGGSCLLYSDIKATNGTQYGNKAICDFSMYLPVFTSGYALLMTIYYGYATFVSFREQHIGRTMWIMPWLLVNSVITVVTFIASCVFSVGLYLTCSRLTDGTQQKCHEKIDSLSEASNPDTYVMMQLSQDSYWISTFLWIVIFAVSVVRLIRNLKARAAGDYVDPTVSDTRPIVEMTPTS